MGGAIDGAISVTEIAVVVAPFYVAFLGCLPTPHALPYVLEFSLPYLVGAFYFSWLLLLFSGILNRRRAKHDAMTGVSERDWTEEAAEPRGLNRLKEPNYCSCR